MQYTRGVRSIAVAGFIVIALSVSVFVLLDIEKVVLYIMAFMFLLLSELVLFGGLIGLRFHRGRNKGLFLNSGVISALFLYFITTLISVLCVGFFKNSLVLFIIIEIGIIAFFSIATILIVYFSHIISRNNEADAKKVGTNNNPKRGGF